MFPYDTAPRYLIVAAKLTKSSEDDPSTVPCLLEQVDSPIRRFTADGAYDTRSVYELLGEVGTANFKIVIPPRRGAVPLDGAEGTWAQRNATLETIRNVGRQGWQLESGYRRQVDRALQCLPNLSLIAEEMIASDPEEPDYLRWRAKSFLLSAHVALGTGSQKEGAMALEAYVDSKREIHRRVGNPTTSQELATALEGAEEIGSSLSDGAESSFAP